MKFKWYQVHDNLVTLANAMEAEGMNVSAYFIEKPWKWQTHWDYLLKHGSLDGFEEWEAQN